MGAEVDLIINDDRWNEVPLADLAHAACLGGATEIGLAQACSVSLLATSDAEVTKLNEQFRNKPTATNVLSWPTEDLAAQEPGQRPLVPTDPELGDIALAYETCVREAATFGIDVHDHVTHLVLHGFLHLLGYDHVHDEDATVMETLEIAILAKLGIKNPYS